MKSPEEINSRISELSCRLSQGEPVHYYEIAYLKLALQKPESFLRSLLLNYEVEIRKLRYDLEEDEAIVRALSWVLEENNNI